MGNSRAIVTKIRNTIPDNQTENVDAIKLLKALWHSSQSQRFIALRDSTTGHFANIPTTCAGQAMTRSTKAVQACRDVYFAPAAFISSDNRKAENVVGASCFWIDIDVGEDKVEEKNGYARLDEAATAIEDFIARSCLPQPTHVVSTGGGFHIYFALNRPISKKLWLSLALKLKVVARQLNFFADPSRTADIASLMRMPGTLNFKYSPPRPVTLMKSSATTISPGDLADAILAAYDRHCTIANAAPRGNSESTPVDLDLISAILECLFPDIAYPDWFRVAAGIFNCTHGSAAGFQLFDDWSSRGTKYKGTQETRRLWRNLRPDHPNPVSLATLRMMVEAAGYRWETDVIDRMHNFIEVA